MKVLDIIKEQRALKKKCIAVLLDPDDIRDDLHLIDLCKSISQAPVDYVLIGGSLLLDGETDQCIKVIKSLLNIPVVIFPGSPLQVNGKADALLFLSIISGRNPEMLIGHHVMSAPMIKKMNLETIGTGYLLVDCGRTTTAAYMSNTTPIPSHKPEIAAATAMAGEMLGLQAMYLDGGSGADHPVPIEMIQAVSENCALPLIVGGGITAPTDIAKAHQSGADIVVIGTAFEKNPAFFDQMRDYKSMD